jgi:antitoxin HigA-1
MAKTKKLPNIHPGVVLDEEFLKPLSITRYRLAKDLRVPLTRVVEICQEKRVITADTALRLARYFNTSAKFWLGLQEDYDLEESQKAKAHEIERIQPRSALKASG